MPSQQHPVLGRHFRPQWQRRAAHRADRRVGCAVRRDDDEEAEEDVQEEAIEEIENEHLFYDDEFIDTFEFEGNVEYRHQSPAKNDVEESSIEGYNADEYEEETLSPSENFEDSHNTEANDDELTDPLTYEVTERSRQLAKRFGISIDVLHSYDWAFKKKWSSKFISLVEWAAKFVDLNPGLLAANLIAETLATDYLGGAVSSFVIGTDDFYEKRHAMSQKIPAYKSISWKRAGDLTDVNERGRKVNSVMFDSGKDAVLASAVYLKHGEVVLQEASSALGKRFDSIPLETQFALIRLAFNAGHGRATKNLKEYLTGGQSVLILKPQKKSGPQRMASIRTAQGIHLSETFFKSSVKLSANETYEMEIDQEGYYNGVEEVSFENLISPVNPVTCAIDPKKKNAIGFEFDMLINLTADVTKTWTLAADTSISDHTWANDGFVLKIDGNKIEVSTKPFELTDVGRKELVSAFGNIETWIKKVKAFLSDKGKREIIEATMTAGCNRCAGGKGIYIKTTDIGKDLKLKSSFISPAHFIVPIKNARSKPADYYTERTDITAVPQATMGIPLASVSKLVDIIRNSEGNAVGIGYSAPPGNRTGIRSEALYNAQFRVLKARNFFLKKGTYNSLQITAKNFSDSLTGFLILLSQYLWTGVLPEDPRDDEVFSKAYVPLHSKTRFREMYHCLLNADEREVFEKVFFESDNWKNLYSLTLKIPGRKGGLDKVGSKTGNKLFSPKISISRPDWNDFIESIVKNKFDFENSAGRTLVSGPSKAIALEAKGVIVELRRMGFGVLSFDRWQNMAKQLFDKAKSLNA